VFKKINIFESAMTMKHGNMTIKQILEAASIEQLKTWADEIKADERNEVMRTINAELQPNADIQRAYEEWRAAEDDRNVLRLLTLAGIQKHANMSDLEFLERGRRAIDTAKRQGKIRRRKRNG